MNAMVGNCASTLNDMDQHSCKSGHTKSGRIKYIYSEAIIQRLVKLEQELNSSQYYQSELLHK